MIQSRTIRVPLSAVRRAYASIDGVTSERAFELWFGCRVAGVDHATEDYDLEFWDRTRALDFILRYCG